MSVCFIYGQNRNDLRAKSLGFGVNERIHDFVIDSKGDIFIGGEFKKANGIKMKYSARWDGAKWNPFPLPGPFNKKVTHMAIDNKDVIYYAGNFSELGPYKNVEKLYSTNSNDKFGSKKLKLEIRGMEFDQKSNIYLFGTYKDSWHNTTKYYFYTYNIKTKKWSDRTQVTHSDGSDIDAHNSDLKLYMTFTSNGVLFTIPNKGIIEYNIGTGKFKQIYKIEDDKYEIGSVVYDSKRKTHYFSRSCGGFGFLENNCAADVLQIDISTGKTKKLNGLGITGLVPELVFDEAQSILYLGGTAVKGRKGSNNFASYGDFLFSFNLKTKKFEELTDRNSGDSMFNFLLKSNRDSDFQAKRLRLKENGTLVVAGEFKSISPTDPVQNIAELSLSKPSNSFRTDKLHVGPRSHKIVPNTVLTVEGAVSISSSDPAKPKAMNSKYLKDYLLWVEKGIVADDIAFVSPDEWSDYVFDDDYELMELDELQAFIKKHKHLPGIPSEAEILESGYSVLDINAKLMAKIEELVLYSIQLNDKLKEEQELNVEIEKEIKQIETLLNNSLSRKLQNK